MTASARSLLLSVRTDILLPLCSLLFRIECKTKKEVVKKLSQRQAITIFTMLAL